MKLVEFSEVKLNEFENLKILENLPNLRLVISQIHRLPYKASRCIIFATGMIENLSSTKFSNYQICQICY